MVSLYIPSRARVGRFASDFMVPNDIEVISINHPKRSKMVFEHFWNVPKQTK